MEHGLSCSTECGIFLDQGWNRVFPALAGEFSWDQSLDQEDLLDKEMAIHSSILAWEIPWTEKPSGLQPMGSQRVGHG